MSKVRMEPITAPLPNTPWLAPVAPWQVETAVMSGDSTSTRVRFKSFTVEQDGPDSPRLFRESVLLLDASEAQALIAALQAGLDFITPKESR